MSDSARLRPFLSLVRARRRFASVAFLTHLLVIGSITAVVAQPAHRAKRAQPATTSHASPETTGTIATASPKPTGGKTPAAMLASIPDASTPDEGELPPLFNLPSASRSRMRACGERWKQMKLDGEAGDEIWRDFATTCLAAKTDPKMSGAEASIETAKPSSTDPARLVSSENRKR